MSNDDKTKDGSVQPAAAPAAEADEYEYVAAGPTRGWILLDLGVAAVLAAGVGFACWWFSMRADRLGQQVDYLAQLIASQRGGGGGVPPGIYVPRFPGQPDMTVPAQQQPEAGDEPVIYWPTMPPPSPAQAQRHAAAPAPPDPAAVAEATQHLAARIGLAQPAGGADWVQADAPNGTAPSAAELSEEDATADE